MYLVLALLAVVVIGLGFLAFQGRLGGMPPQVDDRPGPDLPEYALTGADLANARFAVVTRGYSMPQVDAVLARVADQMDGRVVASVNDYADWAGTSAPTPAETGDGGFSASPRTDAPPGELTPLASPDVVSGPPARDPHPLGWPVALPSRSGRPSVVAGAPPAGAR